MNQAERATLVRVLSEMSVGLSMLRGEVDVLRGVVLAHVQANDVREIELLTRSQVEAARICCLFDSFDEHRNAAVEAVSDMVLAAIEKRAATTTGSLS